MLLRLGALLVLATTLLAQRRVEPRNTHERLLAIVPMTGAGTLADPRRPLHAPKPGEASDIIGYAFQPSDDGQWALVEFVARDRKAFQAILADTNPLVKRFEKGKDSRASILTEFRRLKRDFDPDRFGVAVQ